MSLGDSGIGGCSVPAAFNKCVSGGGRVRTKKVSGNRYIHLCFKGGKSYAGEVKRKKGK
jgi:hypothetical protein